MALAASYMASDFFSGDDTASGDSSWVFEIPYPEGQSHPECCGHMIDVAPDGSFFVYVAQTESGRRLFLRRRGEFSAVPLDVGGQNVSVSPDSQWIAFYGGALSKVPAAGGEPFLLNEEGFFPQWANDGWVYFGNLGGPLWGRVRDGGGAAEEVEVAGLEPNEIINYVSEVPGDETPARKRPGPEFWPRRTRRRD